MNYNKDVQEKIIGLLGMFAEEEEHKFAINALSMVDTKELLMEIDPEDEDESLEESDFDWDSVEVDGYYIIERRPEDSVTIYVRADPEKYYNDVITDKLGMWLDRTLDAHINYNASNYCLNIDFEGQDVFFLG